ncbi:acyltransferase ChoActase/COT/CPT [Scleroderma yunnanense]
MLRVSRRGLSVPLCSPMSTTAPPKLPRLPVPDLHKTMAKYLDSLQPVLLQDQLDGGPPVVETLKRHEDIVHSFLNGPGQVAQARLRALDKVSPHNWLDDNFWLKKTYLEWRAPLLINSNWWLTFVNDADVPEEVITDKGQGFTPWQIRRAACLVHGILDFKHRMQSQELYPDTSRVGIWLRRCTSAIFNTCRVPHLGCDTLASPAAPTSPWASHIIVMAHDFFYALRVVDPESGAPLEVDAIERRMRSIVLDVLRRKGQGDTAVRVGVLSSDERDEWAKNYAHLRSLSPQNVRSLDAIHDSLFVISLDHWSAPSTPANEGNGHSQPLAFPTDKAVPRCCPLRLATLPTDTKRLPHISDPAFSNSAPHDLFEHQQRTRAPPALQNRFFDKPLQLIVERTTRAGACGEHAPVDALVPSVVCEWAVARASGHSLVGGMEGVPLFQSKMEHVGTAGTEDAGLSGCEEWSRLDFDASPQIDIAISDAIRRAETLVADSDHDVLYFTEFGGDEMQRLSNYLPDAFVQLALQLAYYRLHRRTTPVYETALTRSFHHGRTETIRSLTRESFAFVRSCGPWKGRSRRRHALGAGDMKECDDQHEVASTSTLYALLTSALRVHVSLTRAAVTGRGIDRHLLGLRNVLSSEWDWLDSVNTGDEIRPRTEGKSLSGPVALFEHPDFWKSQTWRLSTSGLTAGWYFRGTGFGAPFSDGYGINYLIAPSLVRFCVDSKHSCPSTSTHAFMTELVNALRDMKEICLNAQRCDEEPGDAKVDVHGGDSQPSPILEDEQHSVLQTAHRTQQPYLYARL